MGLETDGSSASSEGLTAQTELARGSACQLPPGDYVSPGMSTVLLDFAFPEMRVGDRSKCAWYYLRREIPHNWYVDRRMPAIGFLSRDEAHILFNILQQFRGKRALEIGCWMGWSAAHSLMAGVQLDIIDPVIRNKYQQSQIIKSLQAVADQFGLTNSVQLVGGFSPDAVQKLAVKLNRRWSFAFIDGNHDAPFPLNDTAMVTQYMEPDAMILFHDLVSPDVAQGLDYLRDQGWNTRVYQTMQIMGVAWRGAVCPVEHQPDPSVQWVVPAHLRGYEISGQ